MLKDAAFEGPQTLLQMPGADYARRAHISHMCAVAMCAPFTGTNNTPTSAGRLSARR
jgi:hypothetical protein